MTHPFLPSNFGENPGASTPSLTPKSNYTIRETAMILGIGRARVVQLEQRILQRFRELFLRLNITSIDELENIPLEVLLGQLEKLPKTIDPDPFQSRLGWVPVNSILSLNHGSTNVVDILNVFHYFKPKYESILRPKVFSIVDGVITPCFRIEALGYRDGKILARIWPLSGRVTSEFDFTSVSLRLFTESVFSRDEGGAFDVPIVDSACFE
jgi:hypothetical protein